MSSKPSRATPPAKRRVGCPKKRTPKLAARICRLIADGLPFAHAANAAGIANSTLCVWRNSSPEFEAEIQAAVSAGIAKRLKVVRDALQSRDESVRLRSACWWLTHAPQAARYFSETSRIELDADLQAQVAFLVWPHQQTERHETETNHRLTDASPDAS